MKLTDLKNETVKTSIIIPVIILLTVFIVIQVVIIGTLTSIKTKSLADEVLEKSVSYNAAEFEKMSAESYSVLKALEPIILNMYEEKTPRGMVIDNLGSIIANNDSLYTLWTCWEPNAYDGRDSEYANADSAHDSTGRFIPLCYSVSGGYDVEALVGYDNPTDGEYYLKALETGKFYVTSSYKYDIGGETVMLYSMCMPIKDKSGKVLGVIGGDIRLDDTNKILSSASIMGNGYIFSMDTEGTFTTHPTDAYISTSYTDTWLRNFKNDFDDMIQNGGYLVNEGKSDVTGTYTYLASTGVQIGDYDKNWIICGVIPRSTVNQTSNMLIITVSIVGLVILLAISLVLFKIISSKLKELPIITDLANKLGDGEINEAQITGISNESTKNEVALLKRAFARIIDATQKQAAGLNSISSGDLTVSIHAKSERDVLNTAMSRLINNLNDMFSNIGTASNQVNNGADQVAGASQTLSQGATEQASAIEELSASIMEISDQVKENSANASKAADIALEASSEVKNGNEQMNSMLTAMDEINSSSNEIGKIIKVIDDIAFQTNILALNAAVEAARAGAAGKGFAVVADEVRNLASKSADAAKQTTALIESSISSVNNGVHIAGKTAESLKIVAVKTDEVGGLISDIARASQNQAEAISQINVGVTQISSVVQNNSATAEESAAASEELAGQANLLRSQVEKFKLK